MGGMGGMGGHGVGTAEGAVAAEAWLRLHDRGGFRGWPSPPALAPAPTTAPATQAAPGRPPWAARARSGCPIGWRSPSRPGRTPTPTPIPPACRGEYMVNWSPKLGTAVSDLEVEYSEEPGFLYHFK